MLGHSGRSGYSRRSRGHPCRQRRSTARCAFPHPRRRTKCKPHDAAGATTSSSSRTAESPWQNGVDESFNSRFREECLNMEWFRSRREAKILIEVWRRHYNQVPLHSSLGYRTPDEFRRHHDTTHQGAMLKPMVRDSGSRSTQRAAFWPSATGATRSVRHDLRRPRRSRAGQCLPE